MSEHEILENLMKKWCCFVDDVTLFTCSALPSNTVISHAKCKRSIYEVFNINVAEDNDLPYNGIVELFPKGVMAARLLCL